MKNKYLQYVIRLTTFSLVNIYVTIIYHKYIYETKTTTKKK